MQRKESIAECRANLSQFMQDQLSIVIHDDVLLQSDKVSRNAPLFDMDAKAILNPICAHFHIKKYDILDEINPNEICEDIKTLIAEIKSM